MIFLVHILILLLGLLFVFLIVSYLSAYRRLLKGEAPFVPVPKTVVSKIVKALDIKKDSVVYDLGCGDGRVLFAAHEFQPKATYIGLEKNLSIYLCAWIRAKKIKKPHSVKILKKDFFSEDISGATHVFAYLMSKMMENLTPKFQKELAPGTRVVSCDFPLKTKEPVKIVEVEGDGYKPSYKLFVYDF